MYPKSNTTSFCDLPTEIVGICASFIDHPSDLLQFALTDKLAADVVIPHHINYRSICCGLSAAREEMWEMLATSVRGAHTQNLSIVEEQDFNPGALRIPVGPQRPSETRSVKDRAFLSSVVERMPNLRCVRWVYFNPAHGALCYPPPSLFKKLSQTAHNLTHFEMVVQVAKTNEANLNAVLQEMPALSNLLSFKISINTMVTSPLASLVNASEVAFKMLVERCPELHTLAWSSSMPTLRLQTLLQVKTWTNLRVLYARKKTFMWPVDIADEALWEFLASLPSLRCLDVPDFVPKFDPFRLPRGLRVLGSLSPGPTTLKFLCSEQAKELEYVRFISPNKEDTWLALEGLPKLRSLGLKFDSESWDKDRDQTGFVELPRVTRLVLYADEVNEDLIGLVSRFPGVTHLTLVPSDSYPTSRLEGTTRDMVSVAPSLTYVYLLHTSPVKIIRCSTTKEYKGWKKVPSLNMDPFEWMIRHAE